VAAIIRADMSPWTVMVTHVHVSLVLEHEVGVRSLPAAIVWGFFFFLFIASRSHRNFMRIHAHMTHSDSAALLNSVIVNPALQCSIQYQLQLALIGKDTELFSTEVYSDKPVWIVEICLSQWKRFGT
jgi:hypothetical protein